MPVWNGECIFYVKRSGVIKLLKFESTAGTFHIARDPEKRYSVLFNDEPVGHYADIADAIESFVHESDFYILHPELGYPLDTYDLSIPDDISGWQPC